jgi:hypothetical protein
VWWVPYTLKKRDRIIAAVNWCYFRRTHKFGIELPKTVEEALSIDKASNTTFWRDAITKEMKNVSITFDILEGGRKVPIGFQFVKCHFVFDIKLGTLIRKARLCAGGHMTGPPGSQTYASVLSRESVRIGLTITAL